MDMSNNKKTTKGVSRFNFSSQHGGRDAITRMLQAYGFNTRQALCDHLGVSQSTMANRWMRDTFPHDWLIACHLDTDVPLLWLCTGEGSSLANRNESKSISLVFNEITNGVFSSKGEITYDPKLIPNESTNPVAVKFENVIYLVDDFSGEITDGVWLFEIDGLLSIRQINRFPGGKLRVENGKASFECSATDVKVKGKVISILEYQIG